MFNLEKENHMYDDMCKHYPYRAEERKKHEFKNDIEHMTWAFQEKYRYDIIRTQAYHSGEIEKGSIAFFVRFPDKSNNNYS